MPERVILSTYPLLDFLTRLLTRVRVLFLLILPLPDSYHGNKNLDFEENIVDTNAYIVEQIRRTHLLLRADKGRHYRLLQAEYWPTSSDGALDGGALDGGAATLRGTR